jgi:hypothetical protein
MMDQRHEITTAISAQSSIWKQTWAGHRGWREIRISFAP